MQEINTFPYKKILIVGCGGAGKSTLARAMGQKFGLPVIHLDKIWWLPGWREREIEEFDALLEKELTKPSWIIEGNFARTFAFRLEYADMCIFLDYPEKLCLDSVHERQEKYRGQTRPDMTDGCPEQIDPEFDRWIRSFETDIKPKMLDELNNARTPYKIFLSREQTDEWLKSF